MSLSLQEIKKEIHALPRELKRELTSDLIEEISAEDFPVSAGMLDEVERRMEESGEIEETILKKTGDPKKARLAGETWLIRTGLATEDAKLIHAGVQAADSGRSLDLQEATGKTRARQKDRQLTQKDTDLKLAERRVAVLEKKIDDAKKTLSDPSLSMPQREARMKEMFGIGA